MSRSYSQRSEPRTNKQCDAEFLIQFDGLDCIRPNNHDGLHVTFGDNGGWVSWRKGKPDE